MDCLGEICSAICGDFGGKPRKMYCLRYTYTKGAASTIGAHRPEAFRNAKPLEETGALLMGGPLLNPCDGAMLYFDANKITKSEISAFAQEDADRGIIEEFDVREYMAAAGQFSK